jgi:hypothetical protein
VRRSRPAARQSFADRNRSRLILAGALIVALALGGLVYVNLTTPAYACSQQWTAEPTSTPAPGATPRLGYNQEDMGHFHEPVGTAVKYSLCPPASGNHWSSIPLGPIPPRVYGPNEKTVPEGWVHNLEHGALVLVYNCGKNGGDGCSDTAQATMKALYNSWPASPICGFHAGDSGIGPVMTRFDDMAYPYAALVWDEILPLQTLDTQASQQVLTFFQQEGERFNPEHQCAAPSAAPSTVPSTAPTTAPTQAPATLAPSAAPAAS